MVDISEKQDSKRTAKARARVAVSMAKETILALKKGDVPKGDVLLSLESLEFKQQNELERSFSLSPFDVELSERLN